ncbi:uncharacterized protein N7487_002019 [Penicillium crustosum]|uniref:uncharacterized protein n=1 Tax=Penicillium crustosum TaxID=36656 RepID=UPI0023A2F0F2|nr:uncharacterized protein N7487_002019 [Penicillium crustosum]KAJ5418469.1 hypothetical protein N7487_002019 [Penicillium crustosum]
MANNMTNIISIIVNPLPPPAPQPTFTPQSSPSPSASGTSRSMGEILVSKPGFWAVLAVVILCIAGGAGYFIRRRLASKEKGSEGIPLPNIGTREQREDTCGDLPTGDNVEGRVLVVTPQTPTTLATPHDPQTPTPPKRKRRLTSSNLSSGSTVIRNGLHGLKEPFGIDSPAAVAGLTC